MSTSTKNSRLSHTLPRNKFLNRVILRFILILGLIVLFFRGRYACHCIPRRLVLYLLGIDVLIIIFIIRRRRQNSIVNETFTHHSAKLETRLLNRFMGKLIFDFFISISQLAQIVSLNFKLIQSLLLEYIFLLLLLCFLLPLATIFFIYTTLDFLSSPLFMLLVTTPQSRLSYPRKEPGYDEIRSYEQSQKNNNFDGKELFQLNFSSRISEGKYRHADQEVKQLHADNIDVHSTSYVGLLLGEVKEKDGRKHDAHGELEVSRCCSSRGQHKND